MGIIQDQDRIAIKKQFENLSSPVKLINFTQEIECQYCKETHQLINELSELSDKISAESYNFITDKEATEKFKIEQIPATVIMGDEDKGIRYYGIPGGYEFAALMDAIKMVSDGNSGLSPQTKDFLKQLKQPVDLKVFVTPTCPHCPRSVSLAFRMAMESPLVTAAGIEAIEFPHLANKYSVQGVPRTVINDKIPLEGAYPEPMVVEAIKKALGYDA